MYNKDRYAQPKMSKDREPFRPGTAGFRGEILRFQKACARCGRMRGGPAA